MYIHAVPLPSVHCAFMQCPFPSSTSIPTQYTAFTCKVPLYLFSEPPVPMQRVSPVPNALSVSSVSLYLCSVYPL